ncbi:uncharacterized protein H6S33_002491 [Morchella sextelata]|uniref:uncharacterized protein n=1 Tax=Morchella sextelata TaxID=1174677 RepID=UPI001D05B769|nr:uncharacterized protein H6S33_002491 [Morchella sextelata]KAH0607457.1 hypothetical protein H6S33_002491 [Morchella sextelata]
MSRRSHIFGITSCCRSFAIERLGDATLYDFTADPSVFDIRGNAHGHPPSWRLDTFRRMNKRSVFLLVVTYGQDSRWVFFISDSGCPWTYLSHQAGKTSGIDDGDLETSVMIGRYPKEIHSPPAHLTFTISTSLQQSTSISAVPSHPIPRTLNLELDRAIRLSCIIAPQYVSRPKHPANPVPFHSLKVYISLHTSRLIYSVHSLRPGLGVQIRRTA